MLPVEKLPERKLENYKLILCIFACLSFAAIFIVDLSYVLFSVSDWHQLSSFMLFFVFHIYLYSLELVVSVTLFFALIKMISVVKCTYASYRRALICGHCADYV